MTEEEVRACQETFDKMIAFIFSANDGQLMLHPSVKEWPDFDHDKMDALARRCGYDGYAFAEKS